MGHKKLIVLIIFLGVISMLQAQRVKSGTAILHVNNAPKEEVDNTPPSLRLITPDIEVGERFHTVRDNLDLVGEVTDKSKIRFISINKEILLENETGMFVTTLNLSAGENEIRIKAMDDKDNLTTGQMT